MSEIRLAILASGSGTTAEAIVRSKVVNVVLILSNNSMVGVKDRALDLNIPFEHKPRAPHRVFKSSGNEDEEASSLNYGDALLLTFKNYGVTHISQNGWMVPTPKNVIQTYDGRIFNQHPGPLDPGHPDFGGKGMFGERVHESVLRFSRETGHLSTTEATIHRVIEEYDKGELMMTESIPILKNDTAESLAERLLPVEHSLQIRFWEHMVRGPFLGFHRSQRLILDEDIETLEKIKKEVIAEHSEE